MQYYDEISPDYKTSILGTEYSVYSSVPPDCDPLLDQCGGYFDKTVKRIVVSGPDDDSELADFEAYRKTNLRHELIHAFFYESGLDGNSHWNNGEDEHPEQTVEWMAIQFPKILKVFEETKAL